MGARDAVAGATPEAAGADSERARMADLCGEAIAELDATEAAWLAGSPSEAAAGLRRVAEMGRQLASHLRALWPERLPQKLETEGRPEIAGTDLLAPYAQGSFKEPSGPCYTPGYGDQEEPEPSHPGDRVQGLCAPGDLQGRQAEAGTGNAEEAGAQRTEAKLSVRLRPEVSWSGDFSRF
jgi:hypothetical protein